MNTIHQRLDAWLAAHFDESVDFLQALVRQPTDTPPGDNAPHGELTARLLDEMGLRAERHPVPADQVEAAGLRSITNLIVRRAYGPGPVLALNAHGDVVPPGEGWHHPPYGAEIVDDKLYGRAAAVSKSDFATYVFALRAVEALGLPLHGTAELHFTYDEEFGGELGPGWLLREGLSRPDHVLAAGFSYEVIDAHNGCLQIEVDVRGRMAHAAIPTSGVDALRVAHGILAALYEGDAARRAIRSTISGINHPYLNVGWIEGGTHTNVVPGRVRFKLDRRMIPEEDPCAIEADLRATIETAAARYPEAAISMRRLLLARALTPRANGKLAPLVQRHAEAVLGEAVPIRGTPLYTDARLYAQAGAEVVLYGAGPRTVEASNAKRPDEHLDLGDLRRATRVVARVLWSLLGEDGRFSD